MSMSMSMSMSTPFHVDVDVNAIVAVIVNPQPPSTCSPHASEQLTTPLTEALLKELQDALAVVLATQPGSGEDGEEKQGPRGKVAGQVQDIEEMEDA
jgi:hypothetical protein